MKFRSFDSLRMLDVVARHMSFTQAAGELHLTKGAVSYQIKHLEEELGFPLFTRAHGGVQLTNKGREVWHASQLSLDALESELEQITNHNSHQITIGMTTYFASRWLSPRLMGFTNQFPEIGLRLQPTVGEIDIIEENIHMQVRWGNGSWTDLETELLFACPAIPTAGQSLIEKINQQGLDNAMADITLLHDCEGSDVWRDWHELAGVAYHSKTNDLVILDPNVRVQAVIDGQGVALNDYLIESEISQGSLFQFSDVELSDYGYHLAYPKGALDNPVLSTFRNWIVEEARTEFPQ